MMQGKSYQESNLSRQLRLVLYNEKLLLMNKFIEIPHKPIWLGIPLMVAISLVFPASTFDLQVHSSFYVLSSFFLASFFSLLLGLIGIVYWLLRKKNLSTWMTIAHLYATFIALLLLLLSSIIYGGENPQVHSRIYQLRSIMLIILFASQCLFLVNIAIATAKMGR